MAKPQIITDINNLVTNKATVASPTFSGNVVLPTTTTLGNVSSTEINYLSTVTSDVQTQINAKAPTASPIFTGTVALDGGQIKFPAIQVPSSDANTLDDYEEGTFTPTIVGITTQGTVTYSSRGGSYTKIGNTVYIKGYISWSAFTGTGAIAIQGIPFTSTNNSHPIAIFSDAFTFAGQVCGSVEPNGIIFYSSSNGGTLTIVQADGSGSIWFAGTYQI